METLVETKICRHCSAKFDITDKDIEFYAKVSPVFCGVRYEIPSPTLCPKCREIRRMTFKNDRKLYKRTCDLSGKNIISIFSPDKEYKVYHQEDWWRDSWNSLDYSRDFDFSRPFFDQFQELVKDVPRIALMNYSSENSEYCNYAGSNKSCYLVVGGSWENENCSYGTNFMKSSDCFDCFGVRESQNSYELYWCNRMYSSFFCLNCDNSRNCYFSINLEGCDNCIFCNDLTNKSYHIRNKPVSEEEFNKAKKMLNNHSQLEESKELFKKMIDDEARNGSPLIHGSEDVEGNFIIDSKNLSKAFLINQTENGKYLFFSNYATDIMDCTNAGLDFPDLMYETINCGRGGHSILFCQGAWNGNREIMYCDTISASENCFGCTGLKNKKYCILNKQYTKEEYEDLVPKIIEHMKRTGEWGEYFPSRISPFGYNETVANEYYPISKNDALSSPTAFKWSDYENPTPSVTKIIPASKLPERIGEIPDDISNWIIECEETGKPYRIIKQELDFYRKNELPIPRRHPDERHQERINKITSFKNF